MHNRRRFTCIRLKLHRKLYCRSDVLYPELSPKGFLKGKQGPTSAISRTQICARVAKQSFAPDLAESVKYQLSNWEPRSGQKTIRGKKNASGHSAPRCIFVILAKRRREFWRQSENWTTFWPKKRDAFAGEFVADFPRKKVSLETGKRQISRNIWMGFELGHVLLTRLAFHVQPKAWAHRPWHFR